MSVTILQHSERFWTGRQVRPAKDIGRTQFISRRTSQQFRAARMDRAGPEHGGDPVIVVLRDGIEFVIVTASTFYGKTQECRRGCVNHVFQSFVKVILRIIGFVVPCAQSQETGCCERLRCGIVP